jgi:hypothetical protein
MPITATGQGPTRGQVPIAQDGREDKERKVLFALNSDFASRLKNRLLVLSSSAASFM